MEHVKNDTLLAMHKQSNLTNRFWGGGGGQKSALVKAHLCAAVIAQVSKKPGCAATPAKHKRTRWPMVRLSKQVASSAPAFCFTFLQQDIVMPRFRELWVRGVKVLMVTYGWHLRVMGCRATKKEGIWQLPSTLEQGVETHPHARTATVPHKSMFASQVEGLRCSPDSHT